MLLTAIDIKGFVAARRAWQCVYAGLKLLSNLGLEALTDSAVAAAELFAHSLSCAGVLQRAGRVAALVTATVQECQAQTSASSPGETMCHQLVITSAAGATSICCKAAWGWHPTHPTSAQFVCSPRYAATAGTPHRCSAVRSAALLRLCAGDATQALGHAVQALPPQYSRLATAQGSENVVSPSAGGPVRSAFANGGLPSAQEAQQQRPRVPDPPSTHHNAAQPSTSGEDTGEPKYQSVPFVVGGAQLNPKYAGDYMPQLFYKT